MYRFFSLNFLFFCFIITTGNCQSKIIISQYVETETGTSPKGIELFNVSNSYIAFSPTNKLEIFRGLNGGNCQPIITVDSGILYQNQVMVFGTTDVITYANANANNLSSSQFYNFTFNGNDAISIYLAGVLQDQFGVCGSDPGVEWKGSGVSTANQNIAINNGICDGNPTGWVDPSSHFSTISTTPSTNLSGMGSAPQACSVITPTIIAIPNQLTNFNYFETSGPSPTKTFTIEGIALTSDLVVTAPTNFEISLNATSNFTQSIVFTPINANVSKTTIYVRLKAGLMANTFSENIAIASTGAPNVTVSVTGQIFMPLANLVISEIMYNTTGSFDDEWIEVCNVSGSNFNISNYQIKINAALTYTFPSNSIINDGTCVTISLGDGGGTEFNVDCPFIPNYGNPVGTDKLPNSSGKTISLLASDGLTTVDEVAYSPSDGADGNGSSLHLVDLNLDNHLTSSNWQEVPYGGSPGINSLVSTCAPTTPEINVEGNLAAFPDIKDGDTTPSGLDNTLFAGQFVGSSQTKSYRIQNLGGADLIINNLNITGANSGDFTVSLLPNSVITPGSLTYFEITFSPTTTGVRIATVSISNNDSDENPYKFTISGSGLCYENNNTIWPTSGPTGTVITVTGTNLNGATAKMGNLSITPVYISNNVMEVTVPNGAVSGTLIITDNKNCTNSFLFDVLDEHRGGCEGNVFLNELFISEVTDATYGGLTYIEIYNPTANPVNLNQYSIRIFFNGNTTYDEQLLSGILLPGDVFVLSAGVDSPLGKKTCNSIPGGNGDYADISSTILEGINKTDSGHDFIGLYHNGGLIDAFGILGNNTWMDSIHTSISGDGGFNFRRLSSATNLPSTTFIDTEWLIIDRIGSGASYCSNNDYTNIGSHDYSSGLPPSISLQPTIDTTECSFSSTLTVEAEEGYVGGNEMNYQWYVLAPNGSWLKIDIADTDYLGQQSSSLTIIDSYLKSNHQYYVQVKEADESCYKVSNSVKLKGKYTVWDGLVWSNGIPDLGTLAIIDGDYNTTIEGSFSACQLKVTSGNVLLIENTKYLEVENDIWVYGSDTNNYGQIIVRSAGSVIQNNKDATTHLIGTGNITVEKETAPAYNWYEYTYWSSPVQDETIGQGLAESSTSRRYIMKGENYLDALAEQNNNNSYSAGQDGIDDDGNDWVKVSSESVMKPGVGYAATQNKETFGTLPGASLPIKIKYTFNGQFNNGTYNLPVYRNDSELKDTNWNFLGNPYPSAIDALAFLDANIGTLSGAIYLWSQNTAPSSTANGNQALNFSDSDYAIINGSGAVAGGDGITPDMFIPSCQGFFVEYANDGLVNSITGDISQGSVIFTNEMRVKDGSANSKFFRTRTDDRQTLRLDLTTESNAFSQILVSFNSGATNNFDGIYFDAPRTRFTRATIYTMADDNTVPLAIQGRSSSDLNELTSIPLGFYNSINNYTDFKLSISDIQGSFLTTNPIYIKDNLTNSLSDLTKDDYEFQAEIGNDPFRFTILFQNNILDVEKKIYDNEIVIRKINNGLIEIHSQNELMSQIEMFDVLGRLIINKSTFSDTIQIKPNTENGVYLFKITIENGIVINKRILVNF